MLTASLSGFERDTVHFKFEILSSDPQPNYFKSDIFE